MTYICGRWSLVRRLNMAKRSIAQLRAISYYYTKKNNEDAFVYILKYISYEQIYSLIKLFNFKTDSYVVLKNSFIKRGIIPDER